MVFQHSPTPINIILVRRLGAYDAQDAQAIGSASRPFASGERGYDSISFLVF